jgi:hypothetical protein
MAIHLYASLDVLAAQPLFSTMEISGKRENYDPTHASKHGLKGKMI